MIGPDLNSFVSLTNRLDCSAILKTPNNQTCNLRTLKSLSEELYKRFVLPFYTLIISLIAASLILEPKSQNFSRFHKIYIFLIGSSIIIISQLSLKYFLNSYYLNFLILFLPIILVLFYYLLLLTITKFKLNFL